MKLQLPKTAAALAEAVAVVIERPSGVLSEVDLRGRILGTDAEARKLFAILPRRIAPAPAPARTRGGRPGAVRKAWQGASVDHWFSVQTPAPRAARHVGTARRIYYRSGKRGGRVHLYVHDFGSPGPAAYRAGPNWFFWGGKKHVSWRGIEN